MFCVLYVFSKYTPGIPVFFMIHNYPLRLNTDWMYVSVMYVSVMDVSVNTWGLCALTMKT